MGHTGELSRLDFLFVVAIAVDFVQGVEEEADQGGVRVFGGWFQKGAEETEAGFCSEVGVIADVGDLWSVVRLTLSIVSKCLKEKEEGKKKQQKKILTSTRSKACGPIP